MEPEPLRIEAEDEILEFDRQHAFLYTFMGANACYDHVFVVYDGEDGHAPSAEYIWSDNPVFPEASEYLFDNDFPLCLNGIKPSKQDREVWRWQHGLEEFDQMESFPEHWNNE